MAADTGEIHISMQSENGEWLRGRLSAIAKQQGGEDSEARGYRNKLVREGLTKQEYDRAIALIGVEV